MPESMRRYQQVQAQNVSSSGPGTPSDAGASPLPVPLWAVSLALIFILALGAWWFTQPALPPAVGPVASASPSATPPVVSVAPAGVTALSPQTLTLGDAAVTVRQKSEPTDSGRIETLEFSSDKDTTFYVLYVVPKETYATATELKAENLDFQDAIVLEEDPVLVVPVVLKGGEKKKHSVGVKHQQRVAFWKVVLPDTEYTLKHMGRVGQVIRELAEEKKAIALDDGTLAEFQKLLADESVSVEDRVLELEALVDDAKREQLETAEFFVSRLKPVVLYDVTLAGLNEALIDIDYDSPTEYEFDFRKALHIAPAEPFKKDGVTFTKYALTFDFSRALREHGKLPFGDRFNAVLTYSFPGVSQETFRIPIVFINADRGRRELSDYVVAGTVYVLADDVSVPVPVLNNLPYDLTVTESCVQSTLPSRWSSYKVTPVDVKAVGGCLTDFGMRVVELSGLTERTRAPLYSGEPLDYRTSPNFVVGCAQAQDVVDNAYAFFVEDFERVPESEGYQARIVLERGSVIQLSTVIHLGDPRDDVETCPVKLPSGSSVDLSNGHSYVVSISVDSQSTQQSVLSAEAISSRPWEYFISGAGATGADETTYADRDVFFQVAQNMADKLKSKKGAA